MNSDEVQVIHTTWEIPMENPTESGVAILELYFTKYPSNLDKFPWFKEIPMADWKNNARFKAHANRIMRVFDDSIKSLGHDWAGDKLEEIWSKLGQTHFQRQIEKRAFNELKEVVLEILTAACQLNEEQAAAWDKLIDCVYSIVFKTLDQLAEDAQ